MNLLDVPLLALSFIMVFKGADLLADSIWGISLRKHISAGMLGMVLAGLMTTLPELTVSTMASALGDAGISVGNAIGSTIFNVLGIIGICGLIRPLSFDKSFLRYFGRNVLLVYLAFYALALVGRSLGAVDAIILLVVLCASITHSYRRRFVGAPTASAPRSGSLARDLAYILVGGAVLGSGSYLLIHAATSIASALHVPKFVIGLSLVAVGTSIPEFATGLTSTMKRVEEISIGNVLGANVYDVTLVLACATLVNVLVHGEALTAEGSLAFFDLPVMIGAVLLLMIVGRNGIISRRAAAMLVVLYAVYILVTFSGIVPTA